MDTVLFSYYSHNNYLDTLKEVYEVLPYLYSLDYLHLFYLKQAVLRCYLSVYAENAASVLKPIILSTQLDVFSSYFLSKWGYAIVLFGIVYILTNIIKFRFQYGFNFYLTYFKTLSDLGEQEFGSYDDYKFFLFLLVQILA